MSKPHTDLTTNIVRPSGVNNVRSAITIDLVDTSDDDSELNKTSTAGLERSPAKTNSSHESRHTEDVDKVKNRYLSKEANLFSKRASIDKMIRKGTNVKSDASTSSNQKRKNIAVDNSSKKRKQAVPVLPPTSKSQLDNYNDCIEYQRTFVTQNEKSESNCRREFQSYI
jgi:hypothetical protein